MRTSLLQSFVRMHKAVVKANMQSTEGGGGLMQSFKVRRHFV